MADPGSVRVAITLQVPPDIREDIKKWSRQLAADPARRAVAIGDGEVEIRLLSLRVHRTALEEIRRAIAETGFEEFWAQTKDLKVCFGRGLDLEARSLQGGFFRGLKNHILSTLKEQEIEVVDEGLFDPSIPLLHLADTRAERQAANVRQYRWRVVPSEHIQIRENPS